MLDEIKENEILLKVCKNKEQQRVPQNPTSVRRSTRLSRPPERFSHSLYYLLMTNYGEPECYEEAMQVETRKKCEQGMNEEMNLLVRNQT